MITKSDYKKYNSDFYFRCHKCEKLVKCAYRINDDKEHLVNYSHQWLCEGCLNEYVGETVIFT